MQKTILILGLICSAFALPGCNRSEPIDAKARVFEVRGIVRGFAPDGSSIDIQHEDIPGFMPSMTMPFTVRNQKEIAGLKLGDAISFRMMVTEKDLLLDQVRKIAESENPKR